MAVVMIVAKTKSISSERALHGQLLSLGLWMTAAGERDDDVGLLRVSAG